MKGARMDMYENVINALGRMAEHNLNEAMLLEACLEFTMDALQEGLANKYFRERFGERLHYLVSDIIAYKE